MHVHSPETLGKVIRDERRRQNITQETLATMAGVGARFLGDLERGKASCEIGKTFQVLNFLGLECALSSRSAV